MDADIDLSKPDKVPEWARREASLAAMPGSVADLRTVSDLLAAALVGEYPAEAALERYCSTLARPYDAQVVMAKFRSKPHRVTHF